MCKPICQLLLCASIAISLTVSATEPLKLSLAKRYHGQIDIHQYLVSEKLDGVRGYWDGEHLYTRNGVRINPPPGLTHNWPKAKLHGELWMGRGRFDEVSGIVRRHAPNAEDWQSIRFMVFDLHDPMQTFATRLQRMRKLIRQSDSSTLQFVVQSEISDEASLMRHLAEVTALGGEGLILHRKDALYRAGRSNDILKLKQRWDAEARVIAHIPGKGKYRGMLGSLLVQGVADSKAAGKHFKIGTGFSDLQRRNPPEVGAIITYHYLGYTQNGLPRFASFLRLRNKN